MNECEAFSERLKQAMLATPKARKAGTKHGVDTAALQKVAGVSREMARRYIEGLAIPRPDTMRAIADWLGVRLGWLRDAEGDMRVSYAEGAIQAHMVMDTRGIYDTELRNDLDRLINAVAAGEIDKAHLEAALKLLLPEK